MKHCNIAEVSNPQQLFTFYLMTSTAAKNNFTEYLFRNTVDV